MEKRIKESKLDDKCIRTKKLPPNGDDEAPKAGVEDEAPKAGVELPKAGEDEAPKGDGD